MIYYSPSLFALARRPAFSPNGPKTARMGTVFTSWRPVGARDDETHVQIHVVTCLGVSASFLSLPSCLKNKSNTIGEVCTFLRRDADMAVDGPGINRSLVDCGFKAFHSAGYYQHKQLYFRMSKAPQVSDLVVQPNVTFKAVTGASSHATSASIPIAGADDSVSILEHVLTRLCLKSV